MKTEYPAKVLLAWGEAISGHVGLRDWLIRNGYPELGIFTFALRNKDDARKRWGEEQVHIWRRSYDVSPPGGESLRAAQAVEELEIGEISGKRPHPDEDETPRESSSDEHELGRKVSTPQTQGVHLLEEAGHRSTGHDQVSGTRPLML